jgi:2-polyprenyl-6-methoxyphenol hydroxylase-like FAD-dependent oxidoreductase
LIFDQGIETGFDFIVGAEGAWSKTRKLVSDQTPNYSRIFSISFEIPSAKETAPECYKLTNCRSLFSYTASRAIMPQYLGDGSIKVGVYITQPHDWAENLSLNTQNIEAIKKVILDEFEGWAPELLQFIRHSQNAEFRPLYMLPVGWTWENRPGVTLIGDAAHVMTPFAGQGVDLGMQDAMMLSRAIIKGANSPAPKDALSNEIKSFEKDLFIRAKETVTLTNDLRTMFFFSGLLRSVIEQVVLRK